MSADEAAFLRAVRAAPDDDAPRLQYTDWLDEHAGDRPCAGCSVCAGPSSRKVFRPVCGGTGRAPDGNAERAAFIRVQCELAHGKCECFGPRGIAADQWSCKWCRTVDALRRRERELWNAPLVLRELPDVSVCELPPLVLYPSAGRSECVVRRGFVYSVALTTAAFLGGPCGRCEGQGTSSLVRTELVGPVRREYECIACRGSGRVEGIAAALFAAHPITSVRLTDKSPWQEGDSGFIWFPERDARPFQHPQSDIPDEIFDRMDAFRAYNPLLIKRYSTQEFAEAALSRACVAYGRSLVKELA